MKTRPAHRRARFSVDGRCAHAVLTKSGRAHFRSAAREHVALVRREFLSRFTEDELATLADFWKRVTSDEAREEPTKPPPTSRPQRA